MRTIALSLLVVLTATRGDFDQPRDPPWRGPGWYQISYSIAVDEADLLKGSLNIIGGPFGTKTICEKTLPPDKIEPGLFPMEGSSRNEYWCDEEKEWPPWLGAQY